MASQGDDCYFYYYSTCAKAESCPFRHQPAALGNELTCLLWLEGKCQRAVCKYRHMQIDKNRQAIACFWEAQPTGCLKVNCPFFHNKPRPFGATVAPPLAVSVGPPQSATVVDPAVLLGTRMVTVPVLSNPAISQQAQPPQPILNVPASQPQIPPILNVPAPMKVPPATANPVPGQQANIFAGADTSFQDHVRMFKEMIKGRQASPKKEERKKKTSKKEKGDSSDSEFEQIMNAYEARQKKEKSYQSYKKERRDRKEREIVSSRSKQFSDDRYKSKEIERNRERNERLQKAKQEREAEERRKYRESKARRKEEKERLRKQKEKERKKQGKKAKKEKNKEKEEVNVLSSDDFELVADSGEEDNSNKNDLKDFKDDKEKDVAGSKEEDSVSKAEEQRGEKLEGDVVMMEENSQGNEKEGKLNDNGEKNSNGGNKEKKKTIDEELKELTEKEGDGAGLGFRIKTYEEILREKALRKMLERRQQLQKEKEVAGTAEPEKADTKEVGKGSVEKQADKSKTKNDISKPAKDEPSQVKSKVKSEIRSPVESQVSLPGSEVKGETSGQIKSQIVMVSTAPIWSSRNDVDSGVGQDQRISDLDNSKKLRVVRKVAVKGVDVAGDEVGKKVKDRKSVEMYKPPSKQAVQSIPRVSPTNIPNGPASNRLSAKQASAKLKLKRLATSKDGAIEQQEASEAKESKLESASPDLKVKSFEEIMEEKKARRLGRFGIKNQDSAERRTNANFQRLGEKINAEEPKREPEQFGTNQEKNAVPVIKKPTKESPKKSLIDKPIKNNFPKENKDTITNPFDVRSGSTDFKSGSTDFKSGSTDFKSGSTDFKSGTTDLGKQRILKRNNSKLGLKRARSNMDTLNEVTTKVSRSSSDFVDSKFKTRTVKPFKGSQQKQDESQVKFRKDSFDDDLDDIDLDIGVEVEDVPLNPTQKENVADNTDIVSNDVTSQKESTTITPQHMDDIKEAVNAELRKKEDLLSDEELERELELGDFSSLGSDEEIDDDDLLLELEEMINS